MNKNEREAAIEAVQTLLSVDGKELAQIPRIWDLAQKYGVSCTYEFIMENYELTEDEAMEVAIKVRNKMADSELVNEQEGMFVDELIGERRREL